MSDADLEGFELASSAPMSERLADAAAHGEEIHNYNLQQFADIIEMIEEHGRINKEEWEAVYATPRSLLSVTRSAEVAATFGDTVFMGYVRASELFEQTLNQGEQEWLVRGMMKMRPIIWHGVPVP